MYCVCREPYHPGDTMIQCDECQEWYHPNCIRLSPQQTHQYLSQRELHFPCRLHRTEDKQRATFIQSPLYQQGYVLVKNGMPQYKQVLPLCRQVKPRARYIFNQKINDKKRRQYDFPSGPRDPLRPHFDQATQVLAQIPFTQAQLTSHLLVSLAGCQTQKKHTDYPPHTYARNDPQAPLVLLWAIQPHSTLDIWDRKGKKQVLRLDPGDALVFRGDLVHAGSAYTRENMRIHMYVTPPQVKPPPNRVYFN